MPLHVWLPEAHPAAPSPVSALMSGVMLKTAIYGVLRVTFDLLGTPLWWWGLIAARARVRHGVFRRGLRAVQTDMKRLLAYSSVENIGILFTGIGLAIVFHGVGMTALAALALIAVLYHSAQSRVHEEPAVSRHRAPSCTRRANAISAGLAGSSTACRGPPG